MCTVGKHVHANLKELSLGLYSECNWCQQVLGINYMYAFALRCVRNVNWLYIFADNLVDGMALFHLTNADINAMLPGKIGACRKLTVIIDSFKSSAAAECSSQSLDTATNSASLAETEPSVTTSTSLTPIVDGQDTRVTMPLPMFSTRIKDVLEKGTLHWRNSLPRHCPWGYEIKGRIWWLWQKTCGAYPCLEFSEKKTKWVRFHCLFLCQSVRICLPSNYMYCNFLRSHFLFLVLKGEIYTYM